MQLAQLEQMEQPLGQLAAEEQQELEPDHQGSASLLAAGYCRIQVGLPKPEREMASQARMKLVLLA